MTATTAGLGRAMASGGAVMLLRQAVGACLGLVAVVIITAMIGPAQYGRFAAAQALLMIAVALVPNGIAAALIRRPDNPSNQDWSSATAILLVAGLMAPAILACIAIPIGRVAGITDLSGLVAVSAAATPLAWTGQIAVARLERQLAYRRVALCELGGQATFAISAALLAWSGLGAWAAALALASQQVVSASLALAIGGGLPRPRWDTVAGPSILRYAGGLAMSTGAWQLRHLVNPIFVGCTLGATAVGQVALTLRIVDTLAAAKGIASRVGTAGLAKVRGDNEATRRLVSQGMETGVLAVGLPLTALATGLYYFGHLVPECWGGAATVFPGIAIGAIAGSLAVLWTGVLLLEGRTGVASVFHLTHSVVLMSSALLLVPQWGITGYAAAEVIVIFTYLISWFAAISCMGTPSIARALCNATCFSVSVSWLWLGHWALACAIIPLLQTSTWRIFARTLKLGNYD